MKISKETLAILKNFSGINSNIMFKAGSRLATISPQKNVMAEVTVPEVFPKDFGIYDLSEFLAVVSSIEDSEIEIGDSTVVVGAGSRAFDYQIADKNVLTLPPEKKITFPTPDIEFVLTNESLTGALRSAAIIKATDLSIVGAKGKLLITAGDLKNPLSSKYKEVLGETDLEFQANIKVDNIKMIHQDYKVSISSKKISRWVATTNDMTIFVALESTSTF